MHFAVLFLFCFFLLNFSLYVFVYSVTAEILIWNIINSKFGAH